MTCEVLMTDKTNKWNEISFLNRTIMYTQEYTWFFIRQLIGKQDCRRRGRERVGEGPDLIDLIM